VNPSGICYPQPGKARSRLVLEAFAAGAGWSVRISPAAALEPGAAAFYGVVGIEHLPRLCVAEGRTWFYGDNAFFDRGRGTFFRFAKNAPQLSWLAKPDHDRLAALGVKVQPWRRDGRHIVVVEQSDHFLKFAGAPNWLAKVTAHLKQVTDRPLRIRRWSRDKTGAAATLGSDLTNAWALVTHMSAAANEALLAGVPVFVSGYCAATPMASGALEKIEHPTYPDGREEWAAGLAGMQWTLDEMRQGMAWRALNT
jgi:hypothetical protein